MHAQHIGDELGEHRLHPLPLRGRAGGDDDLSRRTDANGYAFERPAPGALDVIAKSDADVAACVARFFPTRGELAPACRLERAGLTGRIVAAVVNHLAAVALSDARPRRPLGRGNKIGP